MTTISLDDRTAVNDLFDFVDLHGLDDRAHHTNTLNRPPLPRGLETYMHVSDVDRSIGDVVDAVRMIVHRAHCQGFVDGLVGAGPVFYVHNLHRGGVTVRVTAPAAVADYRLVEAVTA